MCHRSMTAKPGQHSRTPQPKELDSAGRDDAMRHLHFNPVYGEAQGAGGGATPKRAALRALSLSAQKHLSPVAQGETERRNSTGGTPWMYGACVSLSEAYASLPPQQPWPVGLVLRLILGGGANRRTVLALPSNVTTRA